VPFVSATLTREFGFTQIWSRGQMFEALSLPAIIAAEQARSVGVAVLRFESQECELLALVATGQRRGIGTLLLEAARDLAAKRSCRRLFLTTTNDNLDALRFYQRRGMKLVALHPGAMDIARRANPTIPAIGHYNIPMRDDLELEYILK